MSGCAKQSAALAVNHSGLPSNPRISVPDSSVRAPTKPTRHILMTYRVFLPFPILSSRPCSTSFLS